MAREDTTRNTLIADNPRDVHFSPNIQHLYSYLTHTRAILVDWECTKAIHGEPMQFCQINLKTNVFLPFIF